MCLIIMKKPEQRLSPEFILSVHGRNRDGWGIMFYNRKGKSTVVKGLDLFGFQKWYNKLQHKELVIHFRMRTDGKINLANAHPYEVVPGMHMMHNGVLGAYKTGRDSEMSDSANFVEKEVRPIIEKEGIDYANTPEFRARMSKFTSSWNKLVFITPKGIVLIEPHLWKHTLSGLLVSNDYAYDVDNASHYGREWQGVTRNSSFQAGTGNYGKAAKSAVVITPPARTNATTHSAYVPPVRTVLPTAKEHLAAQANVADGLEDDESFQDRRFLDDEGQGFTPNYAEERHTVNTHETAPTLAVDNTGDKKKMSALEEEWRLGNYYE